jgi:hypothetical protein
VAEERQKQRELLRTFRLPVDEWDLFAAEVARLDPESDRSKELVNFVRWFNRDPRGRAPKRPAVKRPPEQS